MCCPPGVVLAQRTGLPTGHCCKRGCQLLGFAVLTSLHLGGAAAAVTTMWLDRHAPYAHWCVSAQVKAWCYYESRLLGAHHGLISTYTLETLVLYVLNKHYAHGVVIHPLRVSRLTRGLQVGGAWAVGLKNGRKRGSNARLELLAEHAVLFALAMPLFFQHLCCLQGFFIAMLPQGRRHGAKGGTNAEGGRCAAFFWPGEATLQALSASS